MTPKQILGIVVIFVPVIALACYYGAIYAWGPSMVALGAIVLAVVCAFVGAKLLHGDDE